MENNVQSFKGDRHENITSYQWGITLPGNRDLAMAQLVAYIFSKRSFGIWGQNSEDSNS